MDESQRIADISARLIGALAEALQDQMPHDRLKEIVDGVISPVRGELHAINAGRDDVVVKADDWIAVEGGQVICGTRYAALCRKEKVADALGQLVLELKGGKITGFSIGMAESLMRSPEDFLEKTSG